MRKTVLHVMTVVAIALVFVATASAKKSVDTHVTNPDVGMSRSPVILYFDDMEGGTAGWTTVDNTATATPHFHVSPYMAYEGTNSWWCGTFAYDADGGYGNGWDDRLSIPTTDLTGATYPILTYAFRHDSEIGYDFTYVQAESNGVWINLNRGYDGPAGWTDIGIYGFILASYDNPLNARFRFLSDGAWSDQDGLYASVGGGFMCDIVKVFDYFTGYEYFFDNADDEVHLVPGVPASSGDWWHIIDRSCPAYSDPHSWWCGDDADTSLIPGSLNNSLVSPAVNIVGSTTCTLRFLLHAEVPTVDNDYYVEEVTTDGGANWYATGAWWGDFEQCDGWSSHGIAGVDISSLLPGTAFQFRLTFFTTDNGCGPGAAGGAGIMLDDTWLEDWTGSPVEETTWGALKALYR